MSGGEIATVGSLGGLAALGLGVLYWVKSRLSSGHIVIILRSKAGGELEDEIAELKSALALSERAHADDRTKLDVLTEEHDKLRSEYLAELKGALAHKGTS